MTQRNGERGPKERTRKEREATPRTKERLMTYEERDEYLEMLSRGASPLGICREMELSPGSVARTLAEGKGFREQCDQMARFLDQNVETAVYLAAMKGNVSAQTLWLRHRPAPGWGGLAAEGGAGVGDDADLWERLTDEELVERARAAGLAIPAEIDVGDGTAGGLPFPRRFSAEPEAGGTDESATG